MILKLIIGAIMSILSIFFNMIPGTENTAQVVEMYTNSLTTLISLATQGINFVHFIIGDSIYIIIPCATTLLTIKFVLLPILDFIRRLIPFVNL